MRVSVDIPEPPSSGLDAALAKQFADIQKQLMSMLAAKDDASKSMQDMMMTCMEEQQATLLQAMERMLGTLSKSSSPSGAMVDAVRGLKQTLTSLPGDLKDALEGQYQAAQRKVNVSVSPQVTVAMPKGLVNRLDALESALVNGMRRSRNRTFGSNF